MKASALLAAAALLAVASASREKLSFGNSLPETMWAKETINSCPGADEITANDGEGVTVYLVDSGCNVDHIEFTKAKLEGRIQNYIIPTFVDAGDDFVHDVSGSGSHMASLIVGDNLGIAKKATLICYRAYSGDGLSTTESHLEEAVDLAIAHYQAKTNPGPSLLLLTSSSTKPDRYNRWMCSNNGRMSVDNICVRPMTDPNELQPCRPGAQTDACYNRLDYSIKTAAEAGLFPVVSSGNYGESACAHSPGRCTFAITAGALDTNKARWTLSNKGDCVDVYAPGVDVWGAWHSDSTTYMHNGTRTSTAAAQVAAVAANLLEDDATLTIEAIKAAIVDAADELTEQKPVVKNVCKKKSMVPISKGGTKPESNKDTGKDDETTGKDDEKTAKDDEKTAKDDKEKTAKDDGDADGDGYNDTEFSIVTSAGYVAEEPGPLEDDRELFPLGFVTSGNINLYVMGSLDAKKLETDDRVLAEQDVSIHKGTLCKEPRREIKGDRNCIRAKMDLDLKQVTFATSGAKAGGSVTEQDVEFSETRGSLKADAAIGIDMEKLHDKAYSLVPLFGKIVNTMTFADGVLAGDKKLNVISMTAEELESIREVKLTKQNPTVVINILGTSPELTKFTMHQDLHGPRTLLNFPEVLPQDTIKLHKFSMHGAFVTVGKVDMKKSTIKGQVITGHLDVDQSFIYMERFSGRSHLRTGAVIMD